MQRKLYRGVRVIRRWIVIFLVCLTGFCGYVSAVAKETSWTTDHSRVQVHIGVLAKRGEELCLQKWEPTAVYLSQQIPEYTFQILPLDFDEIRAAVEHRHVHFVLANPSLYVDLENSLGVKRIATLNNLLPNGTASSVFAGTIIVKKDRDDINTLADFKGKSFMAVDRRSLGGYQMALREFTAEGINPERDFSSLLFAGTHDKVVHSVLAGSVDGGTVRSETLERMWQEGSIDINAVKVIPSRSTTIQSNISFAFRHSTQLYPEWPFAKTAATSDKLATRVAIALLQVTADSEAAKAGNYYGWTIPQNYQSVRECLQELRLPPYHSFKSLTVFQFLREYRTWICAGVVMLGLVIAVALLIYRLLANLRKTRIREEEREKEEFFLNSLIESIPLPIYYKDRSGNYRGINRAFASFYGISKRDMLTSTSFDIHPPELTEFHRKKDEELLQRGGSQRFETKSRSVAGAEYDVILEEAVFLDQEGKVAGLIGAVLDITEHRRYEMIMAAKLRLREYSISNSAPNLVQKLLDETELMTGSGIGFFHFLNDDENTISLQMWSTNTTQHGCRAEAFSRHFPIKGAGAWCDCIRVRRPVILNDYASLIHKKKLPEGHPQISRMLAVPVFRDQKIVAVLGVGNRKEEYREEHILIVAEMAELAWDLILKKQAEEEKLESEYKYRMIMESMEDSIIICSPNKIVEYANPAMIRRIGGDITGEVFDDARFGLQHLCHEDILDRISGGTIISDEVVDPLTEKTYHVSIAPLQKSDGSISKLLVFRDISGIKMMESHLQQAQKMEAIGTLAGGIAHDFNNLLCPMLGYAELLQTELQNEPRRHEFVQHILQAGMRAKDLIGQILSFSRPKASVIEPIKLQPIIKEALKLLRSSIPVSIQIISVIDDECGLVMADATHCHQLIMNLCTNSYHAMQDKGGELSVLLRQLEVNAQNGDSGSLKPGTYAYILVKDTGVGIDPAIMDKIFDPYFTTKDTGKGTGLGLAVVKGIVQSYDGDIQITSKAGEGTEVKIFFPVVKEEHHEPGLQNLREFPRGSGHILVVDDELSITHLLKTMLTQLGYTVTCESDSLRARQLLAADHTFDLVITDLMMPTVSGIDLAEYIHRHLPLLPVILCTGFSDNFDPDRIEDAGIRIVVDKPFTKYTIAEAVRKCLD